ncbi:MAG: hypothetical protein MZV70_10640 [Desulfobacterales bacterium]|nr:hypothetical protein [Desulfobacterales bacterium]
MGGVKSCFIITAKAKDTIDLRFWLVKTSAEAYFRGIGGPNFEEAGLLFQTVAFK